jgi:hypothetical protein
LKEGNYQFFYSCVPEEGRVEENENFYKYWTKLTKINTYFYQETRIRIGNAEIHNTVGSFGEPVNKYQWLVTTRFCHTLQHENNELII